MLADAATINCAGTVLSHPAVCQSLNGLDTRADYISAC
jgi:hypothetical protein